MGHRALVAYERDNGKYNVHYSHWGAHDLGLKTRITESTPLGGDNDMAPALLTAFVVALDEGAGDDVEIGGKAAEAQDATPVKPEPKAANVPLEEVTHEMLDFLHHESFYVVDRGFNVSAFQTLRLLSPEGGEPFEKDVGNGVLYRPRWYPKPDENPGKAKPCDDGQAQFRGVRKAAKSMIAAGVLTREDANGWLVRQASALAVSGCHSDIPEYSPYGYPPKDYREGGYGTAVPLPVGGVAQP